MPKNEKIWTREKLVDHFDEGHEYFYGEEKASFSKFRQGPCIHFHRRTVERLRKLLDECRSYAQICKNNEYVELIYATLTAWGMNPMGRRTRLINFEEFEKNLGNHELTETLDSLKGAMLAEVEDISKLEKPVYLAYNYLNDHRVMKIGGNLVGAAKTLHHLLPDLLMPVDKGKILRLLSQLDDEDFRPSNKPGKELEFIDYWKCIKVSHHIARQKHLLPIPTKEHMEKYPMDTSMPKMIDNALVGLFAKTKVLPSRMSIDELEKNTTTGRK